MPKFVYRFTGDHRVHFPFLPADPPSQWLEPGDTVTCSAPVEHVHLELVRDKPKKADQEVAAKTS